MQLRQTKISKSPQTKFKIVIACK